MALSSCFYAEEINGNVMGYFSNDYQEARRKFIDAASAHGFQIASYENPIAGPDGQGLFTDVASVGAGKPEAVMVVSSGTHGVEGFAGSAIQTGLMMEEMAASLQPHVRLVMIHAINPYGFAYLRRFNEDNVDMNRNFRNHSEPYPRNEGYEELADDIAPASLSFWQNLKLLIHFSCYALVKGKSELRWAVTAGQYSHPSGLFYGGRSEAWSNKTINKIVAQHVAGAKRVVIVDLHTGLGPYGGAEVITAVPKDSPEYKRANEIWGEQVKTTRTGESVSVDVEGPLKLAFTKMLPASEITAVTLEFGTLSPPAVFWALRADNWLHHHGGSRHADSRKIKNAVLRAFYPDDDQWKRDIWEKGREVVEQALVYL